MTEDTPKTEYGPLPGKRYRFKPTDDGGPRPEAPIPDDEYVLGPPIPEGANED